MSGSEEIRQVRDAIRTGRNPLWSEAVNALVASKRTRKLGLKIEEVGLIVASRAGSNDWTTAIRPIPLEKPYEQIANHLREARGIPYVRFGDNGLVEIRDGDPKRELEVAIFPIGFVVVGRSPEGVWCNEVLPVTVFTLADILGRDKSELTRQIDHDACAWASDRIRALSGQSEASVSIVTNIDTDEKKIFRGRPD